MRDCLQSLLSDERYLDAPSLVLAAFKEEASKTGLAASNTFVLVEWGSLVITRCGIETQWWEVYGMESVMLHAQILETCMAAQGKPSLKHSALVVTRRALRNLFRGEDGPQRVVEVVDRLTNISSRLGPRAAVLLGLTAGVCARRPHLKPILESQKSNYISFYLREIIGSRSHIPQHLANAFKDFFSEYITIDDLQNDIAPVAEKALLRAPEVVLNDLISPMIGSLPGNIDVASVLADKLSRPLLSNLKSSNARIRDGAVSTFVTVIKHSHDERYLAKVVDEVLTLLSASKLTAAEHRILHSRILAQFNHISIRSEAICKALAAFTSKETNEAALSAELQALSHHLALLITSNSQPDEKTFKACADSACRGLSDKKPAIRKAWVLMVGDFIWRTKKYHTAPQLRLFVESTVPKLLELYQEVTSNILSATQSGVVAAGFVLTALCTYLLEVIENSKIHASLRKASIYERACHPDSKGLSFLSHRVYSRLAGEEDIRWAIRALVACSSQISPTANCASAGDAWAQAIIYFITAASVPNNLRREAATALTECYLEQPSHVAQRIIQGLWSWQEQLLTGQSDSAAAVSKTGNSRLHLAIQAICPSRDQIQANKCISGELLQDQLIGMVVLCQQPLIPHIGWIDICLAVGQDPGDIARLASEQYLTQIRSCTGLIADKPQNAKIKSAAYDAAAQLAFVAPDKFIPILVQDIIDNLSAAAVHSFSPTDIAIARTPEGTAFIDVLSGKGQERSVDKSAKDYDTLKWEAEVRSQLAAKKGQERKLSADERAKVDAQLKKEASIRKNVLALEERLRQGVGIIRALTDGPPTDAGLWFGPCSKALLDVIAAEVGLMLGDDAEMAYLNLAKLVSPRLGSLRQFTGVATLRALGTSILPDNMKEERLGGRCSSSSNPMLWPDMYIELVTRVLYRLRFLSEQRPFDTISLIYILPLPMTVVRANGIGRTVPDEVDEQVTLAFDFFASHADTCKFSTSADPNRQLIACSC